MKKQTFSPILNSEIAPYVCLLRIKNRGLIKRSDLCYLCVCRFCRFRNLRFCFFDPLGEFAFVLLAGFGVDIAFFAFAAGQARTDASFPQGVAYPIQASGAGFAYLSLDRLGMRLCGRTRSVYGRFRCILGDCSASDSLASVLPVLRSMLTAACLRGRIQFFRLAAHGLLRARLSTANSDGVRRGRRRRLACRVCWPALRLVWLPTKRCNKIARGTLPKFNNIRLLLFTFNG